MKYIIGIDGGGTKTDCAAANLNGDVLFETKGNPSNFLIEGTEKASQAILDLIGTCIKKLNCSYKDIEVILIGTAGAGRANDAERLKTSFINYAADKNIHFNKFAVESDARIALEGALSGKPGIILIAGTGSIIFGKDSKGSIIRAGGFGRIIGDEGSGYNLGRKGLNAVSRQYDGRGKPTTITGLIKEKFGIASAEDLITEVYKNKFAVASAAPLVIAAAEDNDEAAIKILNDEADELILHISAMKKKLSLSTLDICFIGSLISSDNLYSKILKEKIILNFKEINIKNPDFSPYVGAVIMARNLINR